VTAQRRGSSASVKPRFDTPIKDEVHEIAGQQRALTLTPDVRIGPLTAGACFETSLRYQTTSAGVLDLGTIRVIDLESRQTLDIAELPDVVSLEQ
jgi:hypothetical protein